VKGEGLAQSERGQILQRISKYAHLLQRTTERLGPRRIHPLIARHRRHPVGWGGGRPMDGILIAGMLPTITIVSHLSDESV
jgi:hypothetical protein